MLKKSNFTYENIKRLQAETGRDPSLLERTVFAFGLLEALTRVGLDFTFKGGTSLMLLLERPRRISTDIDIVVEPGTDIDRFIKEASKIFPFVSCEEQTRRATKNIEKRHFKFFYASSISGGSLYIILDVLFERNNYKNIVRKEIAGPLLNTEGPETYVNIPTVNCILGDKLTAFAPHTIGIPLGSGREMEIIKQLYDIATLVEKCDNLADVKETYEKIAKTEIGYRGLDVDIRETLTDSFNTAITIIGKGRFFPDDHRELLDGIYRIKGHIFGGYSVAVAESQSCRIAHLVANVIAGSKELPQISDTAPYLNRTITDPHYAKMNYVKKASLTDFAHLYDAIGLFLSV